MPGRSALRETTEANAPYPNRQSGLENSLIELQRFRDSLVVSRSARLKGCVWGSQGLHRFPCGVDRVYAHGGQGRENGKLE